MKITTKDTMNFAFVETIDFKEKHQHEKSLLLEIDSIRTLFEKAGFFQNRLDTIFKKDTLYTAQFTLGRSLKTIKIFYDKKQIRKELLLKATRNITDTYFEVQISSLQQCLKSMLNDFVEKGNAFTTIQLVDIKIDTDQVTATLNIISAAKRTIDKIIVKGIDNFPKNYMTKYWNVRKNTLFNQTNLTRISRQINALPFVSEIKPPEVLFTKDSTFVYVYVKKKKSNKFDGLIGFYSDQENNKLMFNGYADVSLNNIFSSGENIVVNWRNNGDERQHFNISLEAPYVFNSSIIPKMKLNVYKQDSSFINTTANIALQYALNFNSKIGLSYINESSTNLRDITISDLNSYSSNLYGISYAYSILSNNILYPLKFNTSINFHTGSRTSKMLQTQQSKIGIDLSYHWALNMKNTIYFRSTNNMLFSENYVQNELFRIGGVYNIRGFNEESITSTLYSILNVEYRYSMNLSSYLYSITDFAYVENKLDDQDQNIYSLGLGYAFNTKFGILNLSYAIGKSDDLPFDVNNSRFHIKILSLF